jgi:hypothetical protein
LFNEFESVVSDTQTDASQQDKRKQVLQEIIDLIKKNLASGQTVQTNQIDPLDMKNIIMPNMCKILSFYTIVSDLCPSDTVKVVTNPDAIQADNAAASSTWRKIALIVL